MPRDDDEYDDEYDEDFEDFEDDDDGDEWEEVEEENPDDGDEFDDDGGDFEYEGGYEGAYDADASGGDDYEPEWWQEGMPDEWWDYYDDSYEVEEWEFAIDY